MATRNEEQRVQEIIADVLRRRETGEELEDEQVLAAHPELADKLHERLKQLRIVADARRLAELDEFEETISHRENTSTISSSGNRNLVPGQQIRHYVLEEQIGLGGFGSVWRARDTKLDCVVAIKIPARDSLTSDDIDRFIREARTSAHLRQHPNIVSVHEADWDDQTPFIVCDLIDGESLGDRIDTSRVSPDDAVNLVVQICGALHHAHEAGVIHRDLKPDNILLDTSGNPHVTDFGLAMRENQSPLSESGQTLGTAPYMSPEQAQGDSDRADRRSDVFSVGIVLYELLTGERPFRGSVLRVLEQICNEDPPSPRSLDAKIPLDLDTICLKCIEKDPNLRYQSAAEVADELLRYQRHEPILAHSVSAFGRLWRWSKRNPSIPWLSLALIMITLTATLIGGYLLKLEVSSMQENHETNVRSALDLTATFAAEDARQEFADRFKEVEQRSTSEALRDALAEWNHLENRDELRKNLSRKSSPKELRKLQGLLEAIGEAEENSAAAETFSWFVCDAEGYQIARHPPENTLGELFDWRSYFTGDLQDRDQSNPGAPEWDDSTVAKLSASFRTTKTNAWVVAISIPIPIQNDKGDLQGVFGIFIKLGDLISIPGMSENEKRFMSIYDARPDKKRAQLIRHYSYVKSTREHQSLPEPIDLTSVLEDNEFRDPIYDETYRAVAKPIDDARLSHLYVVVQEEEQIAAGPGEELGNNLVILGLSLLGLAAAVLFPAWFIILKRVVK